MAKIPTTMIFLASAICFLSLIGFAYGDKAGEFYIQGTVYCDSCRVQFQTRISKVMPDASVKLECKDRDTDKITYTVDGKTDQSGTYKLKIEGAEKLDDEICEIVLIKSSDPECTETIKDDDLRKSARIGLTKKAGLVSETRYANPLGFMRKEPLPECPEVLKELGITPDDNVQE